METAMGRVASTIAVIGLGVAVFAMWARPTQILAASPNTKKSTRNSCAEASPPCPANCFYDKKRNACSDEENRGRLLESESDCDVAPPCPNHCKYDKANDICVGKNAH